MSHWCADLIGKPYRSRARGPEAFDCFGLCHYAWRTRFGLIVPDVGLAIEGADQIQHALEQQGDGETSIDGMPVAEPREGDAVYMGTAYPEHIGLWVVAEGRGGVLHALRGVGVVLTRPNHVLHRSLKIRAFHRPKGLCTSTSSAT